MASPQGPIILIKDDNDEARPASTLSVGHLQPHSGVKKKSKVTTPDPKPQAIPVEKLSTAQRVFLPFASHMQAPIYKFGPHENQRHSGEHLPRNYLRLSGRGTKERKGEQVRNSYRGSTMRALLEGASSSSAISQEASCSFGSLRSPIYTYVPFRPRAGTVNSPVQLTSGCYGSAPYYQQQFPSTFIQRSRSTESSSPDTLIGDSKDHQTKSSNASSSPRSDTRIIPEGAEVIDIEDDHQYVVIHDEDEDPEVVAISDTRFPNARPIRLRDASSSRRRKSSQLDVIELRNPPIVRPFICIKTCRWADRQLRPAMTLELRNGDFLRIKKIMYNRQTAEVKLRGDRLKRTNKFEGLLPEIDDELCFVYDMDLDDDRDHEEQAAIEVTLPDILRVRRLRIANESFDRSTTREGLLTARWKYTRTFVTSSDRIKGVTEKEWSLERLKAAEVPSTNAIPDDTCRVRWRGKIVPGGAYRPSLRFASESPRKRKVTSCNEAEGSKGGVLKRPRVYVELADDTRERFSSISLGDGNPVSARKAYSNLIDLTEDSKATPNKAPARIAPVVNLSTSELVKPPLSGNIRSASNSSPLKIRRSVRQAYAYGDLFSGAGGTTRGAAMAGLHVEFGVDSFHHACQTWADNFPDADCYHMDVCSFCQEVVWFGQNVIVDILHLSPPCQYFSRAHTIAGKDDDMNTASLFAVEQSLRVTRPRVATLEQTFSIIDDRFHVYFNALICQFTNLEYSVRWQIVQLAQWGLPQRRYRLILIGACPGEILPKMPAATHADPRYPLNGLKPYATVNDALATIPRNAEDHDIDAVRFTPDRYKSPWDGDRILPRTMTTSGGQNYHPSGKRDFTLREYAVLQGFPPAHVFRGKCVKKQIGNAVPPLIARVLFDSIKKQLEEMDGVIDEGILLE